MGQIKFYASIAFIVIFSLAIVNYAIGFANDNDAAINLANDPDYGELNSSIESGLNQGFAKYNESSKAFMDSSIKPSDEVFESGGVFKTSGQRATLLSVYGIIRTAFRSIFGGEGSNFGIVINTFIFILGFIMVAYIYKTWVGKNPD